MIHHTVASLLIKNLFIAYSYGFSDADAALHRAPFHLLRCLPVLFFPLLPMPSGPRAVLPSLALVPRRCSAGLPVEARVSVVIAVRVS